MTGSMVKPPLTAGVNAGLVGAHELCLGGSCFGARFARWLDGKRAAVATTWDDFCIGSWRRLASPELNLGTPMTFFANSCGRCKISSRRDVAPSNSDVRFLRQAVLDGHEVGSHTAKHPDTYHWNGTDVHNDADAWLHYMDDHHRVVRRGDGITLSLPSATRLPQSADARVALHDHYIGVRVFGGGNNPSSTDASDVQSLRSWPLMGHLDASALQANVERAIAQREFVVTAGHGLMGWRSNESNRDDECWRPVAEAVMARYFAYLVARKDVVWRATFGEVVKYILIRSLMRPRLAIQPARGPLPPLLRIDFESTSVDDVPAHFDLGQSNISTTLVLRTPREAPLLACSQGMRSCAVRRVSDADRADAEDEFLWRRSSHHTRLNETLRWLVTTAGVGAPLLCTLQRKEPPWRPSRTSADA